MKYAWIKQHRDQYSVTLMCEAFGVSKSGYYDSIDRPESKRSVRSRAIRESVKQVYQESGQIYGSYKIAEELANDAQLETACRNTVATAMRDMGLKAVFRDSSNQRRPSQTLTRNLRRIFSPRSLMQRLRIASGWQTSLTCRRQAVGFTWRWCWTCSVAR